MKDAGESDRSYHTAVMGQWTIQATPLMSLVQARALMSLKSAWRTAPEIPYLPLSISGCCPAFYYCYCYSQASPRESHDEEHIRAVGQEVPYRPPTAPPAGNLELPARRPVDVFRLLSSLGRLHI